MTQNLSGSSVIFPSERFKGKVQLDPKFDQPKKMIGHQMEVENLSKGRTLDWERDTSFTNFCKSNVRLGSNPGTDFAFFQVRIAVNLFSLGVGLFLIA